MKSIKADAHVDTIELAFNNSLRINYRKLSFNVFEVNESLPYLQYMACFVNDTYGKSAYSRVNELLDYYTENIKLYNKIITIKNKNDIQELYKSNQLGVILTVENGKALDSNISNIYRLYNRGIRQMGITWNFENELGVGCLSKYDTGLTEFGRRCIKTMNEINMIVDVSHASKNTFWNIAKCTSKPIMASHSNSYKLCNHKRNLADSQIKEIASGGGVIGVNYCSEFLTDSEIAGIKDVVNHIEYISNLVGVDYVCLGSDFDGVDKEKLPQNLKGVRDINKLEECLELRGFNKKEIKKIMGQNLFEFTQRNL